MNKSYNKNKLMDNVQNKKGPFHTKEGAKIIMDFNHKELFPILNKIEEIGIEVCKYNENFVELFTKFKLIKIEKKFKNTTEEFFNIYHK